MINRQPVTDRLGVIILALHELAAAHIAHALRFRGNVHDVVAGAAVLAHTPAAHPSNDLLVRDLDGHHCIEADTGLLHGLRLGDGAGHPVQNIAVGTVGLLQTLLDDADDDFIGHQAAGVHVLLGTKARGRTVFDGGAEDVAGGNGGHVELFLENIRLSALPGTRSA